MARKVAAPQPAVEAPQPAEVPYQIYADVAAQLGGNVIHIDELVGETAVFLGNIEEHESGIPQKDGSKGVYYTLDVQTSEGLKTLSTSASVVMGKLLKAREKGLLPLQAGVRKVGRYFDLA